jgi:hypothetical protein
MVLAIACADGGGNAMKPRASAATTARGLRPVPNLVAFGRAIASFNLGVKRSGSSQLEVLAIARASAAANTRKGIVSPNPNNAAILGSDVGVVHKAKNQPRSKFMIVGTRKYREILFERRISATRIHHVVVAAQLTTNQVASRIP